MTFWSGCRAERGRWNTQLGRAERKLAHLEVELAAVRADSIVLARRHRADTVRFVQWRDRWHPIAIDTQWAKGDSVPYPVFRDAVVTADSTIQSCTASLTSCVLQRENAEAKAAGFAQSNAELRRLLARPKPLVTPERLLLAAGALLVVGKLTKVY